MKKKMLLILLSVVFCMLMIACGKSTDGSADVTKLAEENATQQLDEQKTEAIAEPTVEPTAEPTPVPTPTPTILPDVDNYEVMVQGFKGYKGKRDAIGVNLLEGWEEPETYGGLQRTEDSLYLFKMEPKEEDDITTIRVIVKDMSELFNVEFKGDKGEISGEDWNGKSWIGEWSFEDSVMTDWGEAKVYYYVQYIDRSEEGSDSYWYQVEVAVLDSLKEEFLVECYYARELSEEEKGYKSKLSELLPLILNEK